LGCREQARNTAYVLMLKDMKGGLGEQRHGEFGANQSADSPAIVCSFIQSLVLSRRASPQIDEPAHAQSVGDLLQALAGRREDAPKT
jgi:hypothetical protein